METAVIHSRLLLCPMGVAVVVVLLSLSSSLFTSVVHSLQLLFGLCCYCCYRSPWKLAIDPVVLAAAVAVAVVVVVVVVVVVLVVVVVAFESKD